MHILPPLNIMRLGGVRLPIIFGNDLLWNDLPYSKCPKRTLKNGHLHKNVRILKWRRMEIFVIFG